MSSSGSYSCDRCKNEIGEGGVSVSFDNHPAIFCSKDGVDLCRACFLAFVEWIKNPETRQLGPVERVARRENPAKIIDQHKIEKNKLGDV